MFQIERLQKIRQIIRKQKSVDVIWLSKHLHVSEVTIRRDLEKLETEGVLIRTYGGAILNQENVTVEEKQDELECASNKYSEKAKELGQLSASIVNNHDILFLDRSKSNCVLASLLKDKTGIIVFTNSIDILSIMLENKTGTVILTGGQVDYNNRTMVNNSIVPFPDISIDKAFLKIDAVDFDFGISVNEHTDAVLYEQIKKRTKNLALIMENYVFDKIGLINVDDILGMNYIIADDGIPNKYKKLFFSNSIQLHQKFNL